MNENEFYELLNDIVHSHKDFGDFIGDLYRSLDRGNIEKSARLAEIMLNILDQMTRDVSAVFVDLHVEMEARYKALSQRG